MKNASRIFNLAKQDVGGYEAYAKQLASLLKGNRKLLEDVLEGLFHIAKADGVIYPDEEQFLAEVAKRFGFTDTEFSSANTVPNENNTGLNENESVVDVTFRCQPAIH